MLQSPGVRPSSAFCGVQEIASQRRKIGHVRTKTTWTVMPLTRKNLDKSVGFVCHTVEQAGAGAFDNDQTKAGVG